ASFLLTSDATSARSVAPARAWAAGVAITAGRPPAGGRVFPAAAGGLRRARGGQPCPRGPAEQTPPPGPRDARASLLVHCSSVDVSQRARVHRFAEGPRPAGERLRSKPGRRTLRAGSVGRERVPESLGPKHPPRPPAMPGNRSTRDDPFARGPSLLLLPRGGA